METRSGASPGVIKVVDAGFAPCDEHGDPVGPHERRFLLTVPVSVRLHRGEPGEAGLSVGDLSAGSLDVALNILNHFVPPETDGEGMVACEVNYASATAHALHREFCEAFLAPMDPRGGEIPAGRIRRWILDRRSGLGKLLARRG